MSRIKRQMEAEDERGFAVTDGHVCDACLDEDGLELFIREHAEEATCSYCGRHADHPIAAPADAVAELIMESVATEWCDPVHELGWDSREGGYQGATIDSWELLDEVGSPIEGVEFQETLIGALHSQMWCKRDYAALHLDEAFRSDWDEFVERVKYGSRFFFLLDRTKSQHLDPGRARSAFELLDGIGALAERGGLLVRLPAGSAFWRVRPHADRSPYTSASDLGTAPADKALQSNRMSPAGIPAFYGAEGLDTALAEARASKDADRPAWSAGRFATTSDCVVLDLVNLPEPPSLFDRDRRHLRRPLLFLAEFAAEVSKPLLGDDREHIDYVPTQVVSEFLRVAFEPETVEQVQGIRYHSAQHRDGVCVVLFVPYGRCSKDPLDSGVLSLRLIDLDHGTISDGQP